MLDAFARAAAAQFAGAQGRDATVQRAGGTATPVRVVVEDGVEQIGEYGQVIGRVTKVSFLRTQWQPVRGDAVTLDGVARKVEAIDSDDGYVVGTVLNG